MYKFTLTLLAGSALALTGCGGNKAASNASANAGAATNNMSAAAPAGTGVTMASAWPEGSRIVVEEGVTYRVDAAGARVRLEPNGSRVVVDNGVRYRVDPDGARVRIDNRGAALKIGDSVITGNAPNGRSDVETPGETVTDAGEDAVEAVGDIVPD